MEGGLELAIKTTKQLYLLFFALSLLAALGVYKLLFPAPQSHRLQVVERQLADPASHTLYHDFDQDGYSERLYLVNRPPSGARPIGDYYIVFYNYNGGTIDQGNFSEGVRLTWLYFGDYTADNYDETLVFTQSGDSLFLSLIDLNPARWLLKREFFLAAPPENPMDYWDVDVEDAALSDLDGDGKKEAVILLRAGLSLYPRGVYVFDIEEKKFLNRFEFKAAGNRLLIHDVTGDGIEEVIVTTSAHGNIHDENGFNDFKCWLFVLDRQLQPVFPPLSFGEYPSTLYCDPIEIEGKRFLLASYAYGGNKPLPNAMYLVNSSGRIVTQKAFPERVLKRPVVLKNQNQPHIFALFDQNKLLRQLDHQLMATRETTLEMNSPDLWSAIDLDGDHQEELLVISGYSFYVFDQNLRQQAAYLQTEPYDFCYFRHNGSGKPVDLTLNGREHFYRLSFQKDPLQAWLPAIYLALAGGFFLLFAVSYRAFAALYVYFGYLFLSLQKSAYGILILNHRGRVRHFNQALHTLLQLREPLRRGQAVGEALKERPEILSAIEKNAAAEEPYTSELLLRRGQKPFKANISIIPFRPKIGLACGRWVEIKEAGEAFSSERLQTWSETVQKIVHDIKNPLSTVKLNLSNLQLSLEQSGIQEPPELREDFQLLQEELQKIQNRVKNLLRLASLENPRIQAICLEELAGEAVMQFRNLCNHELQINVKIDPEVGEIWADPQQMLLVFHILIENALEALNGKGIIEINGCVAQELLDSSQWFAEIEVCDSGPGIPAEYHEKIFEPQFSTKKEGTGLGLAIAKKIIEDHGGKIGLYSREKGGAVFRFTVPLAKEMSHHL